MMSIDRIETWLTREFPGETLRSHLFTSKLATSLLVPDSFIEVSGNYGDAGRAAFMNSLALDADKQIGKWVDNAVYALTDRQLCIASRGGIRERPKELLHAAPHAGLKVYWYDDQPEAGNQFRQLVFVFPDGSWRGDRTGLKVLGKVPKASNANHFIEALGPLVSEV